MNITYTTEDGTFQVSDVSDYEKPGLQGETCDDRASVSGAFLQSPLPDVYDGSEGRRDWMDDGNLLSSNADYNEQPEDWTLPLGLDITTGKELHLLLEYLPHTLIVGRTRSGKSTWLRGFLRVLLQFSPCDLGLSLVDPKGTEFREFEGAPQLQHPVITDPDSVLTALKELEREVFKRFRVLERLGIRSVFEAQEQGIALPYPFLRIFVIDECALLISQCPEIGEVLSRIAAVGAASGCILTLATQQASVKRIPSSLMDNTPNRLCFGVSRIPQSIQAIGRSGAEKLKQPGEFIFVGPACEDGEVHGQGVAISSRELTEAVTAACQRYQHMAHEKNRPAATTTGRLQLKTPANLPILLSQPKRNGAQYVPNHHDASLASPTASPMTQSTVNGCRAIAHLAAALVTTLLASTEWILALTENRARRHTHELRKNSRRLRQR